MRVIALVLLLSFISLPALACSCMAPNAESAMESYNEADVVVEAKILNTSDGWDNTGPLVKMRIIDVIKGQDILDEITVNYNNVPANCGNEFFEDETYIVGLYDTRSVVLSESNARGYGFRMMVSCHQEGIRYYIKNFMKNKKSKR